VTARSAMSCDVPISEDALQGSWGGKASLFWISLLPVVVAVACNDSLDGASD